MVEGTYHKVLSVVVNELLHPLLAVFTPHVRLYKQFYWAWLTSKRWYISFKLIVPSVSNVQQTEQSR